MLSNWNGSRLNTSWDIVARKSSNNSIEEVQIEKVKLENQEKWTDNITKIAKTNWFCACVIDHIELSWPGWAENRGWNQCKLISTLIFRYRYLIFFFVFYVTCVCSIYCNYLSAVTFFGYVCEKEWFKWLIAAKDRARMGKRSTKI